MVHKSSVFFPVPTAYPFQMNRNPVSCRPTEAAEPEVAESVESLLVWVDQLKVSGPV